VLALAGCGGGAGLTKAEYEQKLRSAGDEISRAAGQLSTARSKDEFKERVANVQNAIDAAAHELDAITPPADVAAPNDRLVHGLRGLARDFGQVKEAADRGIDAATTKARQVSSGAASREARQAIREIQRRGYDVGRLGA
jgi:sugar-specific transcriptional regulator TrmB